MNINGQKGYMFLVQPKLPIFKFLFCFHFSIVIGLGNTNLAFIHKILKTSGIQLEIKFQNFQELRKQQKAISLFQSKLLTKFKNNSNSYSWPNTTPIFKYHFLL